MLLVPAAALVHALLAPPDARAERVNCRDEPLRPCPDGLTGPACDIACPRPGACDFALQCDGDGATSGLSIFGATLFALRPEWPEWLVRLALIRFLVDHPDALGFDPGLAAGHLELAPARPFAVDAGLLRLYRFRQHYRGIPVFGRDVTLIAGPGGAAAIRGRIVDGRDEYAHLTAHAPAAAGEASILAHAAERARLPPSALRVAGLRLVAFPRTRTIGWAGAVMHGAALLAHVVVAADPTSPTPAPLLYHVTGEGHGLADEVPIVVRAEDMASAIFEPPIETADVATLPGGAALTGSTADSLTRLANARVVLLDAPGATSRKEALASPMYGSAGPFDADPGARAFDFQSAHVWLQSFYARTDALMHGRWDSLLPFFGLDSAVPPGEFSPRLVAALDTDLGLCGSSGSYCVSSAWAGEGDAAEALQHPEATPPHEMVGTLYLRGTAFSPAILPHEFGHFVDLFASPGLMYEPFACATCSNQCEPGTTDESTPLTETFAGLMAMWYYSELFADAGQSTSCDTLVYVSGGLYRMPHSETCRPTGEGIAYFLHDDDPDCPPTDGWPACDRPEPDEVDFFDGIGLCDRETGYAVDSFYQAFWELLHAESCAPTAPYVCTPLTALAGLPASEAVGAALLYAAQVSSGTYEGFAADITTYFACNFGQAAYEEVNEVLCHHRIRACDAPAPALCDFCGDGVRTGDEACDGGDLGDLACEDLGLVSGALACAADCSFDLGGCRSPASDTGDASTSGSGPGSSTDAAPTTSASSGSGAPEPPPGGLFIDSGPEATDASGCGCRHTDAGATLPWILAVFARRRRAPPRPAGTHRPAPPPRE